jgi:hypothetical protein
MSYTCPLDEWMDEPKNMFQNMFPLSTTFLHGGPFSVSKYASDVAFRFLRSTWGGELDAAGMGLEEERSRNKAVPGS